MCHSGPRFNPFISRVFCGVERRDTPRWKAQILLVPTRDGLPLNSTDSVRYGWIEVRTAVAQNVSNVWKLQTLISRRPHFPPPGAPDLKFCVGTAAFTMLCPPFTFGGQICRFRSASCRAPFTFGPIYLGRAALTQAPCHVLPAPWAGSITRRVSGGPKCTIPEK